MASVKTKFIINKAGIKEIDRKAKTALEQTVEALHTEVVQAQIMPFDIGTMQNDQTFVDISESRNGKVSIITSSPQARRLYFHPEYNFWTGDNPFAGGKWFEPWLKGGVSEDFIQKAFAKLYRRQQ